KVTGISSKCLEEARKSYGTDKDILLGPCVACNKFLRIAHVFVNICGDSSSFWSPEFCYGYQSDTRCVASSNLPLFRSDGYMFRQLNGVFIQGMPAQTGYAQPAYGAPPAYSTAGYAQPPSSYDFIEYAYVLGF
ncbi:hypothetical protein Tco_1233016, partial [Tanacetum coccineum]